MNEYNRSNGCGSGNRSKPDCIDSPVQKDSEQAVIEKDHSPISSMAWGYKGKRLSPSLTPLHPPPPVPPTKTSPNTQIRPPLQPRPSTQDLTLRLRTLLDSVISILKSPSPNPRIHSLHAFYDRIVDLLSSTSSSSSINSHDTRSLDSEMVETLEMEWWNSEIVAAWFGPTRAIRERGVVRTGGEAVGVHVKADMVYVGLHDE
jgi:hypothetical protein